MSKTRKPCSSFRVNSRSGSGRARVDISPRASWKWRGPARASFDAAAMEMRTSSKGNLPAVTCTRHRHLAGSARRTLSRAHRTSARQGGAVSAAECRRPGPVCLPHRPTECQRVHGSSSLACALRTRGVRCRPSRLSAMTPPRTSYGYSSIPPVFPRPGRQARASACRHRHSHGQDRPRRPDHRSRPRPTRGLPGCFDPQRRGSSGRWSISSSRQ